MLKYAQFRILFLGEEFNIASQFAMHNGAFLKIDDLINPLFKTESPAVGSLLLLVFSLIVFPLVAAFNLSFYVNQSTGLVSLWFFSACAALFITVNPLLQNNVRIYWLYLVLLFAGISLVLLTTFEMKSYSLLLAFLEVLEIGVVAALLRRQWSEHTIDKANDYKSVLISVTRLLFIIAVLTLFRRWLVLGSTHADLIESSLHASLARVLPYLFAVLAVYVIAGVKKVSVSWQVRLAPYAILFLFIAISEFGTFTLMGSYQLFFACSFLLFVIAPLPTALTFGALLFLFEAFTHSNEIMSANDFVGFELYTSLSYSVNFVISGLSVLFVGLFIEQQRQSTIEFDRLSHAYKDVLDGSDVHIMDINLKTGMARTFQGKAMIVGEGEFHYKNLLHKMISKEEVQDALALVNIPSSSAVFRFVDPDSGDTKYWARLSFGEPYVYNGEQHQFIVRQIVTKKVQLAEELKRTLHLREEADKAIELTIYDFDIATLDADLVSTNLTEQLSNINDTVIDRLRMGLSPSDFQLFIANLRDQSNSQRKDFNVFSPSSGSNSRWIRVQYAKVREVDGRRRRFVLSWDVSLEVYHRIKLERQSRRLKTATENGGVGIFEFNLSSELLWCNSSARDFLFITHDMNQSIPISMLQACIDQLAFRQLYRYLDGFGTGDSLEPLELNVASLTLTEHTRHLLFNASMTTNAEGEMIVVGAIADNTAMFELLETSEQALTEAELARDQLEEMNTRQAEMFAVIGHELRTPAAAISMILDSTESDYLSDTAATLKSSSAQLLRVIDDLKLISQTKAQVKHFPENVSPSVIVREVTSMMQPKLSSCGVKLSIWTDPNTAVVCAFDAQALRQLMTNLLNNIAVHSDASEAYVGLMEVKIEAGHHILRLTVQDNGRGVAEEHQSRLFDSFYRVDTDREGSGLGLNIATRLAESLGGSINYFPSQYGGAGFITYMRLAQVAECKEPPATNLRFELKGSRILVAEDNLTIQMLTKAILVKAGAEVTVASDGAKALQIFKEPGLFDLVITDLFMPNLDGIGLTQALREQGVDVPIIGVTAATVGEETQQLMAAGASATLAKPLSLSALQSILDKYLTSQDSN